MWWKAALEEPTTKKLRTYKENINRTGKLFILCISKKWMTEKKSLLHHYKNSLDTKNVFDLSCCVCMAECHLQFPSFWMRNLKLVGACRRRGSWEGKKEPPGAHSVATLWQSIWLSFGTWGLRWILAMLYCHAPIPLIWAGYQRGIDVQLWSATETEIKACKCNVE